MRFQLDRAGGSEVLKRIVAPEIRRLGNEIAAEVRASGVDATVDHEVSDRARAVVRITQSNGAALEAKHGLLRRAALARGLEFRGRA